MNKDLCIKVLNAEQIRQADQFTIEHEPIASIDLMERAAEAFIAQFVAIFSKDQPILIFCGTGNNGGDGLVIARLLKNLKYQVSLFIIGEIEGGSIDFKINHEIVKAQQPIQYLQSNNDFPSINSTHVVIDAIFGSGLSRAVTGLTGELIEYLNASQCEKVVAVDIASGLGCNKIFDEGKILKVAHTVTFQVGKLSHYFPQNDKYAGEVIRVDIGLDEDFINRFPTDMFQVTPLFIGSIWKKRSKFMHKGRAGRALIIAGSQGKMGAAVLAAKACMKAGAGLLTMHIPKCGMNIMQTSVPEAMVAEAKDDFLIADIPGSDNYDAVGVGPGLGTNELTVQAIERHIGMIKTRMVLDADVLNILSERKELLNELYPNSIITPHPGEFRRLVGDWKDDYERLELQMDFAKKYNLVVVLKGANTSIATPDGLVYFNPTGNPGMATAGSGDVLTGILTALVGQGYNSVEAAILGVYVHGLAADIYVETNGEETLTASDIIDYMGPAFLRIMRLEN